MIKTNSHIHSKYSWDAHRDMDIETIAKILKYNKIKYGIITDHIEFSEEALSYVITKFKIRKQEIDRINQQEQEKVILLNGAEISEPHIYVDKILKLEELSLDYILGSIHNINRNAKTKTEKLLAYKKYYSDILKMIETNQIDAVAHLDYINRYYESDYSDKSQLLELFQAMIERDIALEINTSAKRRTTNKEVKYDIFPTIDKLEMYFDLGGEKILIGNDAHQIDELTDNLDIIEEYPILKEKKIGIYKNRKFERI